MSPYSKPLSHTILASSLLLLIISPITFGLAGHAFYLLALNFQPGTYTWLPRTTYSEVYTGDRRFVQLVYDWSTENLVFTSAGLGLFAGVFGVVAWVKNLKNQKAPSLTSSDLYIVAVVFAFMSFIGGLVCNSWAGTTHHRLSKTCRDTPENHGVFTCSRELAACRIISSIAWGYQDSSHTTCNETTASRMLIIVLLLTSAVLAASFSAQLWFARKGKGVESMTAYKTVDTERA